METFAMIVHNFLYNSNDYWLHQNGVHTNQEKTDFLIFLH